MFHMALVWKHFHKSLYYVWVLDLLAIQMNSWDRQASYYHCEASEKEDSSSDGKKPACNDEPVLVEEDDKEPDSEKSHPCYFCHLKSPRNVRNIIQNDVRKWRVLVHIWNSVMHHSHNHSCQPRHKKSIADCKGKFPSFWIQSRCQV